MKSCLSIVITFAATLDGVSPLVGQATPRSAAAQNRVDPLERVYVEAMKKDLRTLATAEEASFVDNGGSYYGGTVNDAHPFYGFSPSTNVTLNVTVSASGPGGYPWTAIATHALTPTKCTYQLPNPIVCDAPPPPDTLKFATPREVIPREVTTTLGSDKPVTLSPAGSRSWQWVVRESHSRCMVTGQIVGVSGGDKDIVVLIMTEDAYQDWMHHRPARTYFESGQRSEIAFDVRVEGEGRYRLVVSNRSSGAPTKIVQLQHTTVACTD